jgi:hypothetical protein
MHTGTKIYFVVRGGMLGISFGWRTQILLGMGRWFDDL